MKYAAFLIFILTTTLVSIFMGCSGIQNMYGNTVVGHHYQTNINPHPLLPIEDITFYQPVTSYYTYTISSQSKERYDYFGSGKETNPFNLRYIDKDLSIDLYSRFPTKRRILNSNKTDTLGNISYKALKDIDIDGRHFFIIQFPFLQTQGSLMTLGMHNFLNQANEDSLVKKFITSQQNQEIFNLVKTSNIGFVTVVYITSLLKKPDTDSILSSRTSIQLKLYLIDRSQPSIIKTYKSVTLVSYIPENAFTYNNNDQLDDLKIVKFFKKAYKELFKDKTFAK